MDVVFLWSRLRDGFKLVSIIEILALMGALIFPVPSWQVMAKGQTEVANKKESDKDSLDIPKELSQLYAQSACLLDGDSGRVLFEKNGYDKKANASTTKILTCIVTLENADLEDVVTISQNAAKQPDVQLGAQSGEQFKLKNLLLSLMLESHNDSAVAIAEHVGGSVEGFAAMMNQKAMDIGCTQSHFVTPNGLDASDHQGQHGTTAVELAKIMRYCIKQSPKSKEFLEITRTPAAAFSNEAGSRSFSAVNHNAFLSMMEGALSGKTGFTSKAGYCYVGAVVRNERTFIVALLGCGWPNHKAYKWKDTRKLMEYGIQNYHFTDVLDKSVTFNPIPVENGIPESGILSEEASVPLEVDFEQDESLMVLLKKGEMAEPVYQIAQSLKAPVKAGDVAGKVKYKLGDEILREYLVYAAKEVKKLDYKWCLHKIFNQFLCGV
ncbi:D-alanyl-D-alanine carboxypeptidase (penicillin-binding protein 5/6) [[Clostridium] polysaccharolyticum]|uniref:serine-type D-Ala-D-Ala carboxypeptidase n=1 Tax=[Clostridium] polysaccharolyticum TaxID=29364 RepID=A0A1I0AAK0_9FIRM|nr:D-alanyl-D-alanine carboxypeptidase (penicillin-binding protein 5/6) [[Clostridium] polysaccharolyticum]